MPVKTAHQSRNAYGNGRDTEFSKCMCSVQCGGADLVIWPLSWLHQRDVPCRERCCMLIVHQSVSPDRPHDPIRPLPANLN